MKILKALSLTAVLLLFAACGGDPCKDVSCQNGGDCLEGTCECPPEYEGNLCQYIAVGEYLGTYSIQYEGCFQASPDHRVTIAEVPELGETVALGGLGDYACPGGQLEVEAKLGLNTLSIPTQTVCQEEAFAGYTFMGQGTRKGDTLSLSFSVTYESDGVPRQDNCTATLVKE